MRRAGVILLAAGVLLCMLLAAAVAMRVDARANIEDYLNKGPNDFYPGGHDIDYSVTKLVIDTVGWNATRLAGNLGIGNGNVDVFDLTSTKDVEYPDWAFMCGDVSQQPWMPGLKNVARVAPAEKEKSREGNATGNITGNRGLPVMNWTDNNTSGNTSRRLSRLMDVGTANESTGEAATNNTGRNETISAEQVKAESENLTFAAYHPIQYLRPVRDVLYEHPLAMPGTAYCELIGFVPPSGVPVNVGMKCTGYGY